MRSHPGHLPVLHLGTALSVALVPFIAGLALGGVLLLALRLRRLSWTWALLALPLAYGAWLLYWRAGLLLAAAGLAANLAGARLHMEAIRKGGEEARAARETIGPLVVLRSLIAERGVRRRRRKGKTLAIGRTRRGSVCRVPFGGPGHGVHSLIVGATGEGKTVTMASLLQAHIAAGQGVIVLDPKVDAALHRTAAEGAAAAGVGFREWSPEGPTVYNPLRRGNPTEIADKCLAAHEWSEPHYEMATRRLLGQVLQTLQAAGKWQTHRPSSTNRRARSSSRSTPPPRASRRRSAQPLIELLKGCRAPSELAGALAASRSDLSRVKFLAKADSLHNAVLQRFHMPYFCSLRERMSSEPV